ncbi:uncharacterized protein DS421_5g168160 [Arachis hypogaea]|nr:uncharacterized protein DS421_5g168160 [Arachis hypogaea]
MQIIKKKNTRPFHNTFTLPLLPRSKRKPSRFKGHSKQIITILQKRSNSSRRVEEIKKKRYKSSSKITRKKKETLFKVLFYYSSRFFLYIVSAMCLILNQQNIKRFQEEIYCLPLFWVYFLNSLSVFL